MTTGWGAPLVAYEFTAAIADCDDAAADAVWKGLDAHERAAMVLALGAQTRNTAHRLGRGTLALRLEQLQDLLELTRGRCCGEVTGYAARALYGRPAPAPCCADDGCLRAAAGAIAEIELRMVTAFGFTRALFAVICRRTVRR